MVTFWSLKAASELRKAYEGIAKDSLQNAIKVRDTLLKLTLELSEFPQKHPLDQYRLNNDGTWRAFEKYNYRISYRVLPDQIRIVRLRHVRRSPSAY